MENQKNIPGNSNHQVITTGDWMITLLIAAIPVVGLIMLLVWAFGGGANPSKSNWAKATLIWLAIIIGFYIVIAIIFGAALLSSF